MAESRSLHIVRHAKSSWDYENISDIDRPLKLRGIRDAYEMARRLKIGRSIPELLICSPANRAMHTATIFIRVLEISYSKLVVDHRLFEMDHAAIREVVTSQDDKITRLMIFGHNPYFSEFAAEFTDNRYIDLPTCGMINLDFNVDSWKNISAQNVVSEEVDFPKKDVTYY